MKIVRLTTLLDFGGQEQKYISFTQEPNWLNNDYFFAAIGYGGFAEKTLVDKGYHVTIFNQNTSVWNLKNILLLFRWFKKIKPDVVHTAAAEANFHGTIAAKLAGVKVVINEEIGFPSHSKKAQWIFKQIYNMADEVICVSKAVKKYLIAINELNNNKGIVIYNPVRRIKVVEKKISNQITIVCVGRLEKVKNQELLVKVFSKLENKEVKLILVGDGRERHHLEQLSNQLNCQNRIVFTGFTHEPQKFLASADLFVLPSFSEGFGIAVLEAMQQGVPCLCSNVGGIPEFVEDGVTGWLFNPNDENELLQKMNDLIRLPKEDLARVGYNAQEFVANRFSENEYVVQLEKLYQKLYD